MKQDNPTHPSEKEIELYLLGECSADDSARLAAHLSVCAICRSISHELEQFHDRVQDLFPVEVTEEEVQPLRLRLESVLDQLPQQISWRQQIFEWLKIKQRTIRTGMSLAATLALGLILGHSIGSQQPATLNFTGGDEITTPFKPAQLEVEQLQFDHRVPGLVQIDYVEQQPREIKGYADNEQIQKILMWTLRQDANNELRRQSLHALKQSESGVNLESILVYTLVHDQEPDLRLSAAEALSSLPTTQIAGEAWQRALLKDPSIPVRRTAVRALLQNQPRDLTDIALLKLVCATEADSSIRNEIHSYLTHNISENRPQ